MIMIRDMAARLTLFFAGLLGALGVALSALAAHGGDTHLIGTAAAISLAHAPALLALHAGFQSVRTAPVASLLLTLGCGLFIADLVYRSRAGHGLFPMSAPSGGIMIMAGWVTVAIGAFFRA